MNQLAKTAKAFDTVRRLHQIVGNLHRCSWQDYRSELTGLYGVDSATLDAMHRLGHFAVTDRGVRFVEAA